MTPEVKSRAEPPRMDRRWPVLRDWTSKAHLFEEVIVAARTLDAAGLSAELTIDGSQLTLWAARRIRQGAKD